MNSTPSVSRTFLALCLSLSLLWCGFAPTVQGFVTVPGVMPPYQRQLSPPLPLAATTTTRIRMSTNNNTPPPPPIAPSSEINVGLIGQSLANQALIGSTIWTGGASYQVLSSGTADTLWPLAFVLGVVGFLPLLALSRTIETSESPLVAGLNLSTNMAVLRMFGPTRKPIIAFLLSLLMAGLTGVVEEVTFRGQLVPVLAQRLGDGDIVIGAAASTLVFALLHTNPLGFFKSREAALDNLVLLLLQIVNGGTFCALYLATGYDLAVPIVAHTLYDLYIFYKTHLVEVAGQLEYAQREATSALPNPTRDIETKWRTKRGQEFVQEAKQSFYLMDTNQDGVLSRKELRIALFSYGINVSRIQSEELAKAADLDDSGEIDLDEFLEFIGPTGSTLKAVRNTLLGPI